MSPEQEANKSPDLQQYVGNESGPYRAWDKVNQAMIRHWCDAMGDRNPIYTDPEAARSAGFERVVAPPAMLQAWTLYNLNRESAPGSDDAHVFAVLDVIESMGYPAIVAVNCEQEYERYLEEGDEVWNRARLESVSEEKTTALGKGFFVTEISEYFNQRDELVGRMLFRVFKFRPHPRPATEAAAEEPGKPPAMRRMRPVRNQDNNFFWEGVEKGELRIQKCEACGTLRHPPAPMCPACQSPEWGVVVSSGRGEVYSYAVMHQPPIPPFDYPNPIVLVELEEGTRLVSNLVEAKPEELRIGLPVEVLYPEVEEGLALPQFRPRSQ